MPAKAVAELFIGAVPRGGIDLRSFDLHHEGQPAPGSVSGGPGLGWRDHRPVHHGLLRGLILALTARRAGVAPTTLTVRARAGLVLGLVMYAVDPLGGGKDHATHPWLRGSATGTLEALAWVLLFGTPAGDAAFSPGGAATYLKIPGKTSAARAWQGFTAGLVSNGVGALTVTVLGTGTTALMLKSAWVGGWLYHGQHLTASAVYGRELYASGNVAFYAAICVIFPIMGAMMGAVRLGGWPG